MKNLIRDLFIFLICFIVVYCAVIVFIVDYGPQAFKKNIMVDLQGGYGHTYFSLNDVEKLQNIDLLIIGSSHAYRTFDTRIFKDNGIKAFNLGTSSQSPIQTEMLVKRHLGKLNPRTVIYEVNPGPFMIDGVESALDILNNSPSFDINYFVMTARINDLIIWNTFIYNAFNKFDDRSQCVQEKIGPDTYVELGGFVERELSYYEQKLQPQKLLKLNTDQQRAFERTLDYFSKSETEVILIRTPLTQDVFTSFQNNENIDNYFKSKGTYVNLQNKLPLVDTLHFFDSHHLNQIGAKVVTKKVIDMFRENLK